MEMRHDDFDDLLGRGDEKQRAAAAGPRNGSKTAYEAAKLQGEDYHEDLLGGSPEVSALDLSVPITIFGDVKAAIMSRSPTTFDKMVLSGEMPSPKRVGTRKIWDVRALDLAFDNLPGEDSSPEANDWD